MTKPHHNPRPKHTHQKKWSVRNEVNCVQCFVHAHSRNEAIEIAIARSPLFQELSTTAEIVE